MAKYHNNAKLTKAQREEIRNTKNPNFSEMARRFGVSRQTIAKWHKRDHTNDKSSSPNKIHYALTDKEYAYIKNIHFSTGKTIEQMHEFATEKGINVSQSSIYRCISENIKAKKQSKKTKPKTFKKYEPGFIHIDISKFPTINKTQNYLFVAIDRTTRATFYRLYKNKNAISTADFLDKCINFFPFTITKILTDNGMEFTNRIYRSKLGNPAQTEHLFAQKCKELNIEQRFTPIYHPQTNGMVERANRTIKENTIYKKLFNSIEELNAYLIDFAVTYNLERKHSGIVKELKLKTPFDAILYWYNKKPEIFYSNPISFHKKMIYYKKNN